MKIVTDYVGASIPSSASTSDPTPAQADQIQQDKMTNYRTANNCTCDCPDGDPTNIENCNCFCYKQFSPNQLNLTTALDFKPIQPPVNNPDSEQDNVARPDDLIMHDRRLDRFKRSEKGSSPDFVPFSSRPLMFIANNGTGCMTPKTHWELKYPDPGPDVVEGDKAYPLRLPSGNCSAAGDQTYRGETGNDRRV
jgi:hypothetical protein